MSKPGRKPIVRRPPRRLPDGYISLERRVFADDMRGDMPLFVIWATLICWANICESNQRVGSQQITLKRGQLMTGLDELAKEWQLGIKTVRRCLDYLAKSGRIDKQSGIDGTIITIHKYDYYQQSKKLRANEGAANGHDKGTIRANDGHDKGNIETIEPSNQDNHTTRDLFTGDPPGAPELKSINGSANGKSKKTGPAKSDSTLDAFFTAIHLTHGVKLGHNAQLRSQPCLLVDRVGADVAPDIAEYYVLNERTAWITAARHPFGELVKNWQKYLTNYTTGQKITGAKARTVERDDGNRDAVNEFLARKHGNRNIGV
jgi:hypothetical protein